MRQHKVKERLIEAAFLINGFLVVGILVLIFALLVRNSLPAFQEISIKEFLLSARWNPSSYYKATYGILAMVVSTFMVTVGALMIAVPLGVGAAAYLSEVATPRVREIAKPVVEILAGIPSVVIGFLGIVLVGPMIARATGQYNGLNAINGAVLLAIMALPTIISLSEDALGSVPKTFQQASLALGASRWQTLIFVRLPAASSGILAACMLGMGRAIGETMTVLMATGNAPAMPDGLFSAIQTMTATIAIELGEVAYNTTHYYALFSIGLVLFIITFIINMIADTVLENYKRKTSY